MAIINVENAQIRTAAVEIKTLTVSGRQVTLSLFRQILEESILDEINFKLNGTPWGLVNYFHKECHESFKINVIWQKGNELRRCAIFKRAKDDEARTDIYYRISGHLYTVVRKLEDAESSDYRINDTQINTCEDMQPLIRRQVSIKEDIEHAKKYNSNPTDRVNSLSLILKKVEDRMETVQLMIEGLQKEKTRFTNALVHYCDEYNKLVEPLLSLPHLFIAT